MIEILNKRKKVIGYLKDKKYMDKNENLIAFLDGNVYHNEDGFAKYTFVDGKILNEDDETIGVLEDETFNIYGLDKPNKKGMLSFSKDSGQLFNYKLKTIGYLNGNFNALENADYFGLMVSFFKLNLI